jgi:hypothetical protein
MYCHPPPRFFSQAKLIFWVGTVVSRSEEAQTRGLVCIHWNFHTRSAFTAAIQKRRGPEVVATIPCMPARVAALHACCDDPSAKTGFSVVAHQLETSFLCRYQTHYGSTTECRYSLMTFGIPLAVLPIREDDSIDLTFHNAWLAELEVEESKVVQWNSGSGHGLREPMKSDRPGPSDVIMGRGPRGRKHTGNQILKRLLEEDRAAYEKAGRSQKAMVAKQVYIKMRLKGTRFLAPAEPAERKAIEDIDHWVEVSETEALDRIGHNFRNLRLAS